MLLTLPITYALCAPVQAQSAMNPAMSFIADIALAAFSADEPMQSGAHDPAVNGFNLQQLELAVSKPVDPYFRFDANLVFSLHGVEIEEVYATTQALPGRFQIRAGQFLTRFGRVNATHPHSWLFVDQAFPIGRVFGGEGNRGLGVEASWLAPLPWALELAVSETMAGGEATARSFYGPEDLGVASPLHLQTTAVIEQFFPISDDWSLLWGLSWASGPNASGRDNRSEVYGTDLYLKWRPISSGSHHIVSIEGELLHRRRQVPEDVLADWSSFEQLFWRFSKRWGVAARHEWGAPAFDMAGAIAEDPLDPQWTADRHRLGANLTVWPTEFSRLRLQGARDVAGWLDEPHWSAFLAFEVSVGAHGAHKF